MSLETLKKFDTLSLHNKLDTYLMAIKRVKVKNRSQEKLVSIDMFTYLCLKEYLKNIDTELTVTGWINDQIRANQEEIDNLIEGSETHNMSNAIRQIINRHLYDPSIVKRVTKGQG